MQTSGPSLEHSAWWQTDSTRALAAGACVRVGSASP